MLGNTQLVSFKNTLVRYATLGKIKTEYWLFSRLFTEVCLFLADPAKTGATLQTPSFTLINSFTDPL